MLAKKYDVSLITVKKAIVLLVQDGVVFSRAGKGIYVSQVPDSTIDPTHQTISLIVPELQHPFFSRFIHNLESAAENAGFRLLLASSGKNQEKENAHIAFFQKIPVSGMIIAPVVPTISNNHSIRKLQADNFPFVLINYIKNFSMQFVGTNFRKLGSLAADFLIKQGVQFPGYLNYSENTFIETDIREGFNRTFGQEVSGPANKYQFHSPIEAPAKKFAAGYSAGKKFVELPRKPDGMFICELQTALGFEKAIRGNGPYRPDKLSIVCYADNWPGDILPTSMYFITQPVKRIAETAVQMISEQTESHFSFPSIYFESELLTKDSYKPVA